MAPKFDENGDIIEDILTFAIEIVNLYDEHRVDNYFRIHAIEPSWEGDSPTHTTVVYVNNVYAITIGNCPQELYTSYPSFMIGDYLDITTSTAKGRTIWTE